MIKYFHNIKVGEQFHVENDDGSYNLCFKVLDQKGFEVCLILKGDIVIEFADPFMMVIK